MKIINVASSDNFEDILEAIRGSEAAGVILVVPRSNRVFKSRTGLKKLKDNFEKLGKDVSILSSGSEILENARSAGFKVKTEKEELSGVAKNRTKRDDDIVSLYSEEPQKIPAKPVRGRGTLRALAASNGAKPFKKSSNPIKTKVQNKKLVLVFLSAALISFAFIVFTSVSQARIRIIPGKKDFSINIPVVVSTKITQADEVYGMVPGELIQLEEVVSKTFAASGDKEIFQKAKGKIMVYNNFSAAPQILVATTRFQTPEGLVFRIPRAITIPGMTKVNNVIRPGEIEVEAVADRAGQQYNIEPSDFKIPGFVGSPKYQGFYAKSFSDFSGGFTGRSNFATKEDLEKAEGSIRQEAIDKIKSELAALSDFKILEEALEIETEKMPDSGKVGDLGPEFKVSLKVKALTLAFKKSDIADLVSQYVSNSQNTKVVRSQLAINYSEPKLDRKKMELSLKLAVRGKTAENIDKEKIIAEILGKKGPEIKRYLASLKEVESAQVFLSPFWVRSVPKEKDRVRMEIIAE